MYEERNKDPFDQTEEGYESAVCRASDIKHRFAKKTRGKTHQASRESIDSDEAGGTDVLDQSDTNARNCCLCRASENSDNIEQSQAEIGFNSPK